MCISESCNLDAAMLAPKGDPMYPRNNKLHVKLGGNSEVLSKFVLNFEPTSQH